jgi:transcriptional regulator with XRE-family HTH domain
MLIRKLREERRISQEQLAEATQLSLRTIQRVEAGHRISYASLRALATTFDINADLLERELYAMNTQDDYIEKPLWIRLMLAAPSLTKLDQPGLIRHEVILVAYAFFAFAVSFFIPKVETLHPNLTTTDLLHISAFGALFIAYLASITPRYRDKLKTGIKQAVNNP